MAEDELDKILNAFRNFFRIEFDKPSLNQQEAKAALTAYTTNKIIEELEKLVPEYEPSDSNIVIQTKAIAAILNLKNRIAELRKTL